eukprot:732136-Prymnesium_polylepis.1
MCLGVGGTPNANRSGTRQESMRTVPRGWLSHERIAVGRWGSSKHFAHCESESFTQSNMQAPNAHTRAAAAPTPTQRRVMKSSQPLSPFEWLDDDAAAAVYELLPIDDLYSLSCTSTQLQL